MRSAVFFSNKTKLLFSTSVSAPECGTFTCMISKNLWADDFYEALALTLSHYNKKKADLSNVWMEMNGEKNRGDAITNEYNRPLNQKELVTRH